MSWLDPIRAKLYSDGVATTTYPCTIGYQPDNPDTSIVLTSTAGYPQDTMADENLLGNFQLRVRGARVDYGDVEDVARAAYKSLHNANISGFNLVLCNTSEPLLSRDGKERVYASFNFRTVRPAS